MLALFAFHAHERYAVYNMNVLGWKWKATCRQVAMKSKFCMCPAAKETLLYSKCWIYSFLCWLPPSGRYPPGFEVQSWEWLRIWFYCQVCVNLLGIWLWCYSLGLLKGKSRKNRKITAALHVAACILVSLRITTFEYQRNVGSVLPNSTTNRGCAGNRCPLAQINKH